jgi:hypothetical protein
MLMHLADSAGLFHTATGTAHADLAIAAATIRRRRTR